MKAAGYVEKRKYTPAGTKAAAKVAGLPLRPEDPPPQKCSYSNECVKLCAEQKQAKAKLHWCQNIVIVQL